MAIDPKAWINLERAQLLLLDDHAEGLKILVQIVSAFGVKRYHRCRLSDEAKVVAAQHEIHLILINANLKESSGYEFMTWLRSANLQPNSFAPVILLTGHTERSNVDRARDCGANFVITKPVSPAVILQRILWVARDKRPYVRCGDYIGPDRRFHDVPLPVGKVGRRFNDKVETEPKEAESESLPGADAPLQAQEAQS